SSAALRGPSHKTPALRLHYPPVGGLTMPPTRQTSRPHPTKTPQSAGADSPVPAAPADSFGELVAAAQTGSGEAVERLLAAARPQMMALAMRVLGNADDAEDAVQDATIKVWRNLGRFEGRAAFTTWLHRVAINAALDRLRRRGAVHIAAGTPDEHHHHAS